MLIDSVQHEAHPEVVAHDHHELDCALTQSFPMPDEPKGAIGFQRQMSLKGGATDAVDC
jgi:hypothetical protein